MQPTVWLSIFVVWASLSSFWTFDLVGTAIDVTTLIASVAIGFAIATFGARLVAAGLLAGSAIATIASLMVGAFLPRYGRSVEFAGAFTGIYAHRNFLASVAVICLALSIAHLIGAKTARRRVGLLAIAAVSLLAIALTLSGSAIVLSVAVLIVAPTIWIMRKLGPLGRLGVIPIFAVLLVGVVVPAAVRLFPELAAGVGRDVTLTGRTEIWDIVASISAEQPVLGYGWGGVWRGEVGDSVRALFGWDTARSAHNGYLDALLQVGWVGVVLLAAASIAFAIRAVRLAVASAEFAWMPLVLIAVAVNSFSESLLTRPLGTFLIATIAASSLLAMRQLASTQAVTPVRAPAYA